MIRLKEVPWLHLRELEADAKENVRQTQVEGECWVTSDDLFLLITVPVVKTRVLPTLHKSGTN